MSLMQKLDEDLRGALKASEKNKLSVLRMAKAAIKNRQIQKGGELSDEEMLSVLSQIIKQGRDSIEQFSKAGRTELIAKEEEEIAVLQGYLPRQLSQGEIDRIIVDAVREAAPKNVQEIGKVMRILMPKIKGVADGRYVNERVRELIESGGLKS